MPRMIVSLMRVLWLTCVMVRPAWLRASAKASPMLTPRLPLPSRTARRPGGACAVIGCVWAQSAGPIASVDIPRHAAKATGPAQLSVSYTHLRAHETRHDLVCRLLLEKKKT